MERLTSHMKKAYLSHAEDTVLTLRFWPVVPLWMQSAGGLRARQARKIKHSMMREVFSNH